MQSLYLLIPVALAFSALSIGLLLWAVGNGQYDDLEGEAWRVLREDEHDVPEGGVSEEAPEDSRKRELPDA